MLESRPFLQDPLLGLPTRLAFEAEAPELLRVAEQRGGYVALLFVDLDHFKSINDAFGHAVGDAVLRAVGAQLCRHLRGEDRIYRFGGDEFVLLAPRCDRACAYRLAERLQKAIAETPLPGALPIRLEISVGAAIYPEDGTDPDILLRVADRRMYAAKRLSRGQPHIVVDDAPVTLQETAPLSRLIGREHAWARAVHFLQRLEQVRRGVLAISGPSGVGHTRFLKEVERLARFRHMATVYLACTPALALRQGGVLENLRHGCPDLPPLWVNPEVFLTALLQTHTEPVSSALLVLVDNAHHLDTASQDVLFRIFQAETPVTLGLVYTAPRPILGLPRADIQEHIVLEPLTEEDVHIWLRLVLKKEPAPHLVRELTAWSRGLPKLLDTAVQQMLEAGMLTGVDQVDIAAPLDDMLQEPAAFRVHGLEAQGLFFGRTEELQKVRALLEQHRLVTIWGPGGVGKSRLAAQVAMEALEAYPEGVFWVDLSSVSSDYHRSVVEAILLALNLERQSPDPWHTLQEHFGNKAILLVLDNAHGVPNLKRDIAHLLKTLPLACVLVTHRRPLRLPGEARFPLGGLALPYTHFQEEAEKMAQPSVQLLLHRIQEHAPGFRLQEEDREVFYEVIRQLGGLPLALNLVAPWFRSASPREILARLRQYDTDITPPPLLGLHTLLDEIWARFSPTEQAIVAGLARFPAAFDAEAAQAVTGVSPFFLDALLQHGLLEQVDEGYLMPSILREHFRVHMQTALAPQIQEQLLHAFITWHLKRATDLMRQVNSAEKARVLQWMHAYWPNVRHAWMLAWQHRNMAHLHEATWAVLEFLGQTGRFFEGLYEVRGVLALLPVFPEPIPKALRLLLHTYHGIFLIHLGQFAEAQVVLQGIASEMPELRTTHPEIYAQWFLHLAASWLALGNREIALQAIQRFLEEAHNIPPLFRARAWRLLGNLFALMEHWEKATHAWEQAQTIVQRELNDPGEEAALCNNIAWALCRQGRLEEAEANIQKAVELAHPLGAETLYLAILDTQITILTAQRRFLDALRVMDEALQRALRIHAWPSLCELMLEAAQLWIHLNFRTLAAALLAYLCQSPYLLDDYRREAERLRQQLPESEPSDVQAWQGSVEAVARHVHAFNRRLLGRE